MKITIDQSPYTWNKYYNGTIIIDDIEYGFAIVTQENEQIAEEIINIEWEAEWGKIQCPIENRIVANTEITKIWTEQYYAHYNRETQ